MTTVYRIQPQGAKLHALQTETSNGEAAGGVHVFATLQEVQSCREWLTERCVELVTVNCQPQDVRTNGDYEGDLLLAGRGAIVKRRPFADTQKLAEWVASQK